ncbi:MAG TPA: hypothetical protein VFZ98_03180, partial [Vicinamibacterales bacterium]
LAGRRPSGMWSAAPHQTPTRLAAPASADPARGRPSANGDSLEAYFDHLDAAFSGTGTGTGGTAPAAPFGQSEARQDSVPLARQEPVDSRAGDPSQTRSSTRDPIADWDPDLKGDPTRPAVSQPPIAFPQRTPAPDPRFATTGPVAVPPVQPPPVSSAPVAPVPPPVARTSTPAAPPPVAPPPAAASPAAPWPAAPPPSTPAPAAPWPAAPAPAAAAPSIRSSEASAAAAPTPVGQAPAPAPAAGRSQAPAVLPASLVDAFAALLAAEQRMGIAPSAATVPSTASAPARAEDGPSDELVEQVSRRVLARLSEQSRPVLLDVAERLVREEIERIKQSGNL